MGDGNQADAAAHTEMAAQLQLELDEFTKEWRAIRVEFSGECPNEIQSISEWRDQITCNRIIRPATDDGIPTEDLDFASAWHVAVNAVRDFIYSRLSHWSWRLLNTYGIPSLPDIPSPPTGVLPGDATLEDLVLTPDLAEAGKRVVIWAAASAAAKELQRSGEHQLQFWQWTGQLLKWHDQMVYADSIIVDALQTFNSSLKCFTPRDQTALAIWGGERKPKHSVPQNSIRRLSDKLYEIVLESKVMEIRGVGARRFVEICRWRRIDATSLVNGNADFASSRSVATQEEIGEWETEKLQRPINTLPPAERRKRLAEIDSARQDLEAELANTDSLERREDIEEALAEWQKEQNKLYRGEKSTAAEDQYAVNKSLKKLAKEQRQFGRTALAQLIESCSSSGNSSFDFVYTGPDWEFLGF